jgi:hypothetical protein
MEHPAFGRRLKLRPGGLGLAPVQLGQRLISPYRATC